VSSENRSASAANAAPVSEDEAQWLFGALGETPVLILAVSGGPDSTALLWLAARWRKACERPPKLIAVTIDHGLRPEAKREAQAVQRLARSLGVEHRTLRWTGRKPKTGLQEAARNVRYRLLAEAAQRAGASHIVTAHTLDDQAETVLFRLARGSGVSGLGAMTFATPMPIKPRTAMFLVRPLLDVPKARLVATLKAARISYADDPTNRDPRFTRPRLRELMPLLAREGLTAERLALLARRAARADDALTRAVDEAQHRFFPAEGGSVDLPAHTFCELRPEIGLRLLGRAIERTGDEGPVELGKLEALHRELLIAENRGSARFRRTLAGALVTLAGGHLTVERAPPRRAVPRNRLNQTRR
jgi:tRNA(Ile)-lysidine synthase